MKKSVRIEKGNDASTCVTMGRTKRGAVRGSDIQAVSSGSAVDDARLRGWNKLGVTYLSSPNRICRARPKPCKDQPQTITMITNTAVRSSRFTLHNHDLTSAGRAIPMNDQ